MIGLKTHLAWRESTCNNKRKASSQQNILQKTSWQTDGVLPKIWKDAHVTPVYKKGEKCSPGNYRPISLTSVICKTLEKLIRNAIVDHMEKNSLFNKSQHGFMKTRSCMAQLLETLEEWTDLLDKNFSIDVIYLDFQKAFDTIPHQRLLSKVHAYGIRGQYMSG